MYTLMSEKKMRSHQSDVHSSQPSHYDPVSVQYLFSLPVRYFPVQPSLSTLPDSEEEADLMAHLLHSIIPDATEAPAILTASDDRGRTAIEKHFGWDDLLLQVRKSRRQLMLLADLKKRHTAGEEAGLYEKLHMAVVNWHDGVCSGLKGKTNQLDYEQFLIYRDIPEDG